MATEAQIQANRANAEHSTGPRTEQGKANSCRNNIRWGFRGRFTVLANESQEEFDTLLDRLRAEQRPQCIAEDVLILQMAQHFWLTQRAQLLCDLALEQGTADANPDKTFSLWLRYQTTNQRGFHKCLDQLLKIRAQRFKEAIGFERQKEQSRAREQPETRAQARTEQKGTHDRDRVEQAGAPQIGFERQNSQPKAQAAGKAQPVDLDSLIASIADAKCDRERLLNPAIFHRQKMKRAA